MRRLINFILGGIVLGLIVVWLVAEPPLSSPLGEGAVSQFLAKFPHLKTQKIVYGFLPYWNLDDVTIQPELTHLAYFSLSIAEDGELLTKVNGGTEPGYRQLQSDELLALTAQARQYGTQNHIVLTQFDNDTIETFLADNQAQDTFLDAIDSLLLAYPFNGINLDVEYIGEADNQLRGSYTDFVKKVSDHLKDKYGNIELTVDMYAAAATKKQLWEVENIAPLVDYIIVMAYDFHRSSSPTAGPVAPLFNKEESWDESINSYLRDFSQVAPTEKILLGVPFYGYEWQTTSEEAEAFTLPKSGATASYKRVKELIANQPGIEEHWDDSALAPYLSYEEDGEYYLVYYENPLSIVYKLEYVNQLDLAGIAIWSLGYEGNSRDLWNSIDQTLKIKN